MAATSYTITVNATANEELGIQHVLAIYNAEQLALDPSYVAIDSAKYLKKMLNAAIADYKRQYKDHLRAETANAVQLD